MAVWRQWRLDFDQSSLAEVVGEFNRYNRAPQFRLVGADIANRRYSGVFGADDPESLAELLKREPDLTLQRNTDEIVVQSRARADASAHSR
jgi:ferric-dicitrate binding protein FerR (iron transport regulator)